MQPRAEAVLVCDQVIQDALSGKKTLIGLFNRIIAHTFPAVHPRLFVFASIIGPPGTKVLVAWRIVGPSGHLQDMSMGEVGLSPDGRAEVVADLVGLPFPQPGEYRFLLMLKDEEAGEVRIQVVQPGTETGSLPSTVH